MKPTILTFGNIITHDAHVSNEHSLFQ